MVADLILGAVWAAHKLFTNMNSENYLDYGRVGEEWRMGIS
ncbi:MAG: hypothetical protein ACI9E1_001690 [Cryomorphaceae bacterium]|jgi:hypothetical protein